MSQKESGGLNSCCSSKQELETKTFLNKLHDFTRNFKSQRSNLRFQEELSSRNEKEIIRLQNENGANNERINELLKRNDDLNEKILANFKAEKEIVEKNATIDALKGEIKKLQFSIQEERRLRTEEKDKLLNQLSEKGSEFTEKLNNKNLEISRMREEKSILDENLRSIKEMNKKIVEEKKAEIFNIKLENEKRMNEIKQENNRLRQTKNSENPIKLVNILQNKMNAMRENYEEQIRELKQSLEDFNRNSQIQNDFKRFNDSDNKPHKKNQLNSKTNSKKISKIDLNEGNESKIVEEKHTEDNRIFRKKNLQLSIDSSLYLNEL
ncbi:MAG: hypothetical protein MHMPM18_001033 [Marteilia pararefringens]